MASEILLGCKNINVIICSGVNRNITDKCQKRTRNDRFNGIVSISSFLIHSFVLLKIQIFIWKKPSRPNMFKATKVGLCNLSKKKTGANEIRPSVFAWVPQSVFFSGSLKNLLRYYPSVLLFSYHRFSGVPFYWLNYWHNL